MSPPATLASARGTFRAVVRAVVPAAEALDADGWSALEEIVERAIADRPPAIRRQIVLFLGAIGVWARVRTGRSLDALDRVGATRLLEAVERAPQQRIRQGFWGIRTLALMGYYGRPAARDGVGYRAVPEGWSARGSSAGAWHERAGRGGPEPGQLFARAPEDRGA